MVTEYCCRTGCEKISITGKPSEIILKVLMEQNCVQKRELRKFITEEIIVNTEKVIKVNCEIKDQDLNLIFL